MCANILNNIIIYTANASRVYGFLILNKNKFKKKINAGDVLSK